ncbi:MAG: TlpA family protein disulfide reductase [Propionicimonas sp.]
MTRTGGILAAAGLVLAALLAGCGGPLVPGANTVATEPPPPVQASVAPTDLVAARKAAGIADCPATGKAATVAGGLPDLTLDCLGGGSAVRLAGLRGPLLINLWAQWCEPCRSESAHLAAFASTQKKVAVLGIDYTDPQPELAIEFAQLTGMTYPHLVDEEHHLKGPLGVVGIPYTVLIGADGKIVARHPGQFISLENVQQWVAAGLAR